MEQFISFIVVLMGAFLFFGIFIAANQSSTNSYSYNPTSQIRNEDPRKLRTDQELLDCMRQMTPIKFEHLTADMFTRFGYDTQAIGGIHDEGIDVIAKKDGITNYIQCKKYVTRKVSLGTLRDFYGAIADHVGTGTGYLITTNIFTNEAKRFANGRRIVLLDKISLLEYVHSAKIEELIPDVEHPIGQNQELCPRCENPLVERHSKHGPFLGCSTFPKCWYRKKI